MSKVYDVIVIGGGASGMMAAGSAAASGASVLLLEKNKRLGEKLRISGGGRCNITNVEDNLRTLLGHYGDSEQALYSPFTRFGMRDTLDLFLEYGVGTVVEDRKRAFPASYDANDVAQALIDYMQAGDVNVVSGARVSRFESSDGRISSVHTSQGEFTADSYVLSTGGKSHPETGSTGDGFKWLEDLGHKVSEATPNITPLKTKENWPKAVSGIAAKGAKITFSLDGSKAFTAEGDILFTHFGISGPTILNSAGKVKDLLKVGAVTAVIDCYPKQDEKQIDQTVISVLNSNGKKQLKNILKEFIPAGMAPAIIKLLGSEIDFNTKASEINKDQRKLVVKLLKTLPLTIESLMGFEKAVVADGGVSLGDIDTKTMRSKVITNLHVTGDLLDIRRPTGGYSLQLSWTTGYLAGHNAAIKDN